MIVFGSQAIVDSRPSTITRPRYWLITILEWAIFVSLMVWIMASSAYLAFIRQWFY